METIKKHFNKPQLRSMLIGAPVEVVTAGRATGKTVGILAPKSANNYLGTMPRSTGTAICATFTQGYSRTLKELIRGWQMLGYQMDEHFIVGKRPTEKWIKKWNWKGPYAPPLDYKHIITWYNGAVLQIISQDRPGSTNGMSIDWGIGDEVKLLSFEKLTSEWMPANRGIIPAFANNPYHHGYTFTTDMPVGSSARWILDYADKMDKNKLNDILAVISARYQIEQLRNDAKGNLKKKYEIQIDILNEELNDLRKGFLFYHEASTLENIHALGIDYIKQQLRDTSVFQFETQILNLRPLRLEDGFYPDFDEEHHGYFAEDASYFDNSSIDYSNPQFDCRKDKDLDLNKPLHLSLDYNRRIHPMVIAQTPKDEIRILKGIHSLYPDKLDKALQMFCDYYKFHNKKVVYYWYDQTAVGEQHATRICDDVMGYLRKNGWTVIPCYIGSNATVKSNHEARYRMYGHLFKEDGYYKDKIRLNRENCNKLILSVQLAQTERKYKGFSKDKRSEHDNKFPAEESTHYSEALDTLVQGLLESGVSYKESAPMGGIITG